MVAFLNAQDKESAVSVLRSTNTPPELNAVDSLVLQVGRTVRNCTVTGCTADVKTAITVKARRAYNV